MSTNLKYNIVANDGEQTSVTVFVPGKPPLVATKEHPRFSEILQAVQGEVVALGQHASVEDALVGLFDQSIALAKHFSRLSERITVGSGRVYFDSMPVHNALTAEILRYVSAGLDDHRPLVAFMEKIETNPLEHSRQNLFNWLESHNFALAPDGDFYAYKKVGHAPNFLSSNSGRAIVNGELISGKIPNKPGSIVEMPRDEVQHDPRQGCSTGLHAANFGFARNFGGNVIVRLKINPRDVVSVPTESSGDKMRVCRYHVVDVVTSEDKGLLLRTAERTARTVGVDTKGMSKKLSEHAAPFGPVKPARVPGKKKAPAKKQAVVTALPDYYEKMKLVHFRQLPTSEVKWLAGEWGIAGRSKMGYGDLITALVKEARERLKTW